MDCRVTHFKEKDSFISKLKESDKSLLEFYQYNPVETASFTTKMKRPNNGREKQLAQIIKDYMADLKLTTSQLEHIEALEQGAKVVIGGQQARLFGDLYTLSIKFFR